MSSRFLPLFCAALAGLGMTSASAQSIARAQLTDNDLSCSQICAESRQMDAVMQLAGPGLTAVNAAVPAAFTPARTGNTNVSVNQVAFSQSQTQQLMAGSNRTNCGPLQTLRPKWHRSLR